MLNEEVEEISKQMYWEYLADCKANGIKPSMSDYDLWLKELHE